MSAADKRLGAMLGVDQLWRQTEADWRRIMSGLVGMDSAERQVATGALLKRIAALIRDVADRSHLRIDPDPDTYYLQEILTRNIPAAVCGITEARNSGLMSMLAEQLQEISERATGVDESFRTTVRSTAKAAHSSLIDLATFAPMDPPVAGSAAVLPGDAVAVNETGVDSGARSDAIVGALDSLLALARASAAALNESLAARNDRSQGDAMDAPRARCRVLLPSDLGLRRAEPGSATGCGGTRPGSEARGVRKPT